MDKRHERMLDELLSQPGNDTCADCHAVAPRWASVNLGIFLCVGCASVHRKMGTHRSRVKSVTLDSWTRENITAMRGMGNKASNAIWNPNESLHPPPTSLGAEERDSEIEKYIRRKYEQGAFRKDASGSRSATAAALRAPTSLNRARELDGRLPSGSVTGLSGLVSAENRRNPELNDIVTKKPPHVVVERDLPALPVGTTSAPPRPRPARSASSTPAPAVSVPSTAQPIPQFTTTDIHGQVGQNSLVDLNGGINATLPYQMGSASPYGSQTASANVFNPFTQSAYLQQPQQQYSAYGTSPQAGFSHSPGASSFQPAPSYSMSTSAPDSLAAFDPLHPASQQQSMSQQPNGYQSNFPNQQYQQQQYMPAAQLTNGQSHFAPSGMPSPGFAQPQPIFNHANSFGGQMPHQAAPNGQQFSSSWSGGMGQMGYMSQMGTNTGYNGYAHGMK